MRGARLLALSLAAVVAGLAADFAGSQACASCHAAIYRSFERTPMARSSGLAGASGPPERFDHAEFQDSKGAFEYKVNREGKSYSFTFQKQPAQKQPATEPIEGRRNLEYFVGSGAAARSYLFRVDGFLYEAPVSYYSQSSSWNSAPGYADLDYPYLTRAIQPGCLGCHSSGIQWIGGTQNAYDSPPFREGGVACERCHGPGSDHIAKGAPMLNPARLPPAERDSICEQCHLSGEIRVPKPGRIEGDFQPGGRLADDLAVFVRAGAPSLLRVTSHVENLAQSACKRASGDKLWCGTCHDPHSVSAASDKAAYFRSKCLTCHRSSDCRESAAARQAQADNCIACHMPRNPTADVEHVVFTDHSIRRRPTSRNEPPGIDAELVPFEGRAATKRDLGLAYAMLGSRDQNAAYLDRAFRLLNETAQAGEADAPALAYLAEFYRNRKDDAHALPLYVRAWQLDPNQPAVLAALGAYQMQYGRVDEAIAFWTQALALSPAMLLVRANLAAALLRSGEAGQAEQVLRKALEFNPAFAPAKEMVDRIRSSETH